MPPRGKCFHNGRKLLTRKSEHVWPLLDFLAYLKAILTSDMNVKDSLDMDNPQRETARRVGREEEVRYGYPICESCEQFLLKFIQQFTTEIGAWRKPLMPLIYYVVSTDFKFHSKQFKNPNLLPFALPHHPTPSLLSIIGPLWWQSNYMRFHLKKKKGINYLNKLILTWSSCYCTGSGKKCWGVFKRKINRFNSPGTLIWSSNATQMFLDLLPIHMNDQWAVTSPLSHGWSITHLLQL